VEISIVIESRFGSEGRGDLDLFLQTAAIETISLNREQANLAPDAFHRFGRGLHPAALNFADVFPMPWPNGRIHRCCSRGMILSSPIYSQHSNPWLRRIRKSIEKGGDCPRAGSFGSPDLP
jgi:hypothetical protein